MEAYCDNCKTNKTIYYDGSVPACASCNQPIGTPKWEGVPVKSGNSVVITLPPELRQATGIELGTPVFLLTDDQDIRIRKISNENPNK